eukprot:CAMPEP_0115007046 /NCGR_PEP_ID=MMETSP0216-20121206/20903_1 /TAXON_ID=223996 /ORGANISM="Protocruzia adherens, Strain Boccale" /LENGTH=172 /DNA_ID=CAMNT_0002373827 /DNA_START=38 /DNA_END=556 /DNA_ORIENTATION=+
MDKHFKKAAKGTKNAGEKVLSTVAKGLLTGGLVLGAGVFAGYQLSKAIKEKKTEKRMVEQHEAQDNDLYPLSGKYADIKNFDTADIPNGFVCPITQQIMRDPVMTPYGHTYEREAIEEWINKNHNDPMTQQPLEVSQLSSNYSLRDAIEYYIQQHQAKSELKEGSEEESKKS